MNYVPKHFTLPTNDTVAATATTQPYVFSEDIVIAVDVALATGRPLLVAGPPGCGKSRLAEAMAVVKDWNYLYHTMTSRTRLEELTGEMDHLRRLHDAQAKTDLKPDWAYRNPGIFWWAFDPNSAKYRGGKPDEAVKYDVVVEYPNCKKPPKGDIKNAVLLLDEIDKAEPDLPNDLLEPLDQRSFRVANGPVIKADKDLQLLTIITTNRERELPPAFLRRCISLVLKAPDTEKLIAIGKQHYLHVDEKLIKRLAEEIIEISKKAEKENRRPPGTSEFLDAINACDKLKISVDDDTWKHIEKTVLVKNL